MMESARLAEAQIESSRGFRTDDDRLRPIADKVFAKQSLDFGDGLALCGSSASLRLDWLAISQLESLLGHMTYFNVNRHINPTNVSAARCLLSVFGRKKDDAGAYTMALEEAWTAAATGY